MKVLNVILVALILTFVATTVSYAVYTINLTDMRVENIQIYRRTVVTDPGPPEVTEVQMAMSMNYTLYNAGGDSKGLNTVFSLTSGQRTQILNFIKPFVQSQATTDDVTAPTWAQ
jgi:hypothetical protein